MKATEVVKILNESIKKYGDKEVYLLDEYGGHSIENLQAEGPEDEEITEKNCAYFLAW